jgi:hypothetical protein
MYDGLRLSVYINDSVSKINRRRADRVRVGASFGLVGARLRPPVADGIF